MINAEKFYNEKVKTHKKNFNKFKIFSSRLSNIRFAVFIAGIVLFFVFFRTGDYNKSFATAFIAVALFVVAVFIHSSVNKKLKKALLAIDINNRFLKRMAGLWRGVVIDCGEEFKDLSHPYAHDLDIFGKGSLFQWLSSCRTFFGRITLAKYLKGEMKRSTVIIESRSCCVEELSKDPSFLEEFQIEAAVGQHSKSPQDIIVNLENNSNFRLPRMAKCVFLYLPFVSFLISLSAFLFFGSIFPATILYSVQLIIFTAAIGPSDKVLSPFEKSGELFLTYSKMIFMIENKKFNSKLLQEMQKSLTNSSNESSSWAIKRLTSIISLSQVRYSAMGRLIANIFALTDIRCAINAVEWKNKNGEYIRKWIEIIGEFEVLSSFASIKFENPQWGFLSFSQNDYVLSMENGGHPLIHKSERVDNSLVIENFGNCAVITGSNMSGKSTFLRTVGVNLVLGYCGAVVCATKFSASVMNIYTTMRIEDNLSSNTSTFYAELLKIKNIVDASARGEKVLFLIDELFRGTNSQDQHEGSVAVLKTLANKNCAGLVSTHDLELCSLAKKEPERFVNYHFKEYFEKDKLKFDYLINVGPSKTKNALFLIKMAGIEV